MEGDNTKLNGPLSDFGRVLPYLAMVALAFAGKLTQQVIDSGQQQQISQQKKEIDDLKALIQERDVRGR